MSEKVTLMPDAESEPTLLAGLEWSSSVPHDRKLGFFLCDRPPPVEFDGHRFDAGTSVYLPFLYLAYKARRGDALAVELLTAFKMTIEALDGKTYWPYVVEAKS